MVENKTVLIKEEKWKQASAKLQDLSTLDLVRLSIAQRTGDQKTVQDIIGKLIENEGQIILKKGIQQLGK